METKASVLFASQPGTMYVYKSLSVFRFKILPAHGTGESEK